MNLRNPFSPETKNLYLWNHECWVCGCNQVAELHHIWGRVSSSAFNSAPVCRPCHDAMLMTQTVRVNLFKKTVHFLERQSYEILENDRKFLEYIKNEIKDIKIW